MLLKRFSIDPESDPTDAYSRAVTGLRQAAKSLDPNSATAAMAALGLHEDYQSDNLGERVAQLSHAMQTSDRTTQRRIEDAFGQLAEVLSKRAVTTDPGYTGDNADAWRSLTIRSNVVFYENTVEVFEAREIISNTEALETLHLGFTVPSLDTEDPKEFLDISTLYGGNIEKRLAEGVARFGFWLRLPRPISRTEIHQYGVRVRVPIERFDPYLACVLRRPCEKFDLTVKFTRPPKKIELMSEAFQMDPGDRKVRFPTVAADAANEVRASFRDLSPGLAYGLRWEL
ncbi:hypothetical protein ACWEF6_26270 [Amycolatopsis sp. NPDC004772]